jgi:DNA-binding beta-propeller fold protein YncE
MYSLIHGTLIRSIGRKGSGKGQLDFGHGGLCVTPDGDGVLVADARNNRVQEIQIMDGSWVRFIGEGVLKEPQYVDCNADVIAVSESSNDRVSVLSWADGSLRAQLSSLGSCLGQLKYPQGVRLLADGSGVVVADYWSHRLYMFTLSGEFVAALGEREQGLKGPHDVLECALDGSFIVANLGYHLVKLSRDGVKVKVIGRDGGGNGQFIDAHALAALPNDGYLIVGNGNRRLQHLAHLQARLAWMRACACARRVMHIRWK